MTRTSPPTPGADKNAGPASLARRIRQQGGYETLAILRNGEQLTVALVLPLLVLIALVATPLLGGYPAARVEVATPGVLALCAMSTALTGQGIATGFDRRYGVLRFFSTTPLGRAGLLAGKLLAIVAVLALQVAAIGVAGFLLGWRPQPAAALWLVPLLVLGAAAFAALGFLIAGTVRPEATLALLNLLWVLLGALGGVAIPASRLPTLLGKVAHFLPSGALGDALRAACIQGMLDLWSVGVLAVWTLLGSYAAIRWFKWS